MRSGALALSGDARHRRAARPGRPRASPASPWPSRASCTTRGRRRGVPRGALGYIDPSAHPADEGGARRRQRHGRADGRPAARRLPASSRCSIYCEPDGEFPDHEPNPLLRGEPPASSSTRSRETGAELGIAWDGDADRCFFIDDTGEFVAGDFLTALLAESILAQGARRDDPLRRARRRAVRDVVERAGGTALREPRRPRVLQDPHARDGAAFGGEVSGHYYFRDFYCADSGTIPALLILELLSVEGKTMSELLGAAARALLHLGRDQLGGGGPGREDAARSRSATRTARSTWLDGVSVDYDDWHFNVRPSNTEPLLRLNLESLVSPRAHGGDSATRCWR